MKKKILSILLSVCLIAACLPMAASAEAPLQSQTEHHPAPIVLTDGQLLSTFSGDASNDADPDDAESLNYDFSIEGIVVLTVHLPKSWENHVRVERGNDFLSFRSSANYEAGVGGKLFGIRAYADDIWKGLPRKDLLETVTVNGKTYDIIWFRPTDVQYDFNDPLCNEEYTMMVKDITDILLSVTFADNENLHPPVAAFLDVTSDVYYYQALKWAVEKGITAGTDKTHFSPKKACTRGEAVTFLWRAEGSPEPAGDIAFTDVKSGSYYEKAVRWAVEKGVTSGTGNGKFSPNMTCDRSQIVTFLYRAENQPAITGGTGFTDVKAGQYYENAVKWAVENGITSGTGNGKFSPGMKCDRSQIVTFLYRYSN